METLTSTMWLQRILNDALDGGCSDIHVFPRADGWCVQFRVQGRLLPYALLPADAAGVIRRIKALAKMDVAESRVPQDGSFYWESEWQACSVRAATLPTVRGETAVLRLFPTRREPWSWAELGMPERIAQPLQQLLQQPAGLLLVAGSTGSGKTTTLYTMMGWLAQSGKRVVSIEDPVEMALADCHQV
ncbi:MAG: Flp pilus assembly complex ATPase component TadA [Alicyclobacillus sp.]|nr:Flp pilus assembly complex ATPase component TadA [Alicyclobacillus sp.]